MARYKRAPSACFLSSKDHFTGSKFYSQARIYDTSLANLRDRYVKFSVKANDLMN